MMAFFMRYYKKLKLFIALILMTQLAFAAGNSLQIRSANLTNYEEDYLLNADAEINFGAEMEKAILKGFIFNFLIEFQLLSPRKYWFDDEIVTTVQEVSLTYHALTRQYVVSRNEQQRSYATLDEAIEDLSIIQDMKAFQKSELEKNTHYNAVLLMRLDHKKVPKALQGESDWALASQRFTWSLGLIK